jgi:hypothetical protein
VGVTPAKEVQQVLSQPALIGHMLLPVIRFSSSLEQIALI